MNITTTPHQQQILLRPTPYQNTTMDYTARFTGPLQFQSLMYTAEAVQKYLWENESAEYPWSISRFDY